MALDFQIVQFPFSGGLDEKTQAELVAPGSFLTLTNALHQKDGALTKGFGSVSLAQILAGGGSISSGIRVFGARDQTCLIDGHWLNTYIAGGAQWQQAWRVPEAVVASRRVLAGWNVPPTYYEILAAGNYLITVWQNSAHTTLHTVVIEAATGVVVHTSETIFQSISKPRLGVIGTTVYMVFLPNNLGSIKACTMSISTPNGIATGWSAASTLVSDMIASQEGSIGPGAANEEFDVLYGANAFYLAYLNNSGTNTALTLKSFNSSLTQTGSVNITYAAAAHAPLAIGLGGLDTDTIWLAWRAEWAASQDANVRVQAFNSSLTVTGSTAVAIVPAYSKELLTTISIIRTGAGVATLVAGNNRNMVLDGNGDLSHNLYYISLSNPGNGNPITAGYSGGASFPQQTVFNVRMDSQAFALGGRICVLARVCMVTPSGAQYVTTLGGIQFWLGAMQTMLACIDVTGDIGNKFAVATRPLCWIAPRLSQDLIFRGATHTPQVVPGASTRVAVLHSATRTGYSYALEMVQLDGGDYTRWQPAPIGDEVAMSGGVPTFFDGRQVGEIGFCGFPYIEAASQAAGAVFTNGAVYLYIAVYEQLDADGNLHQGAPSGSFSLTSIAAASTTLTIYTSAITLRMAPLPVNPGDDTTQLTLAIYRTPANLTTYYRVGTVTYDGTTASQSFTDTTPDATLTTQSLLYTQPGTPGTALPKVNPSSFRCMVAHGDRLIGAGDDGVSLWPSGSHVIGEGPWFADNFQIPIEQGGPITALASMDGRLLVFKRSSIAVIDGIGPPDAGGPGFNDPQYLSTSYGCIEPRSVVVTSAGVFFQSLRGIELLTRGLEVSDYFGRPVEGEEVTYPVITSAVVNEADHKVFFTALASDGSASGEIIVYDIALKAWSTIPGAAQSAALIGASPGLVPTYTRVTAAGSVIQLTKANYLSAGGGAFQSTTVETPWINVAGLQGYQRLRKVALLAKQVTGHDLTISLAFDYSPTYTQSVTFTAAQLAALPREQIAFRPTSGNAKCQSVRIKIQDASPSSGPIGTGQGAILLGLALEIGAKKGIRRLPAAANA